MLSDAALMVGDQAGRLDEEVSCMPTTQPMYSAFCACDGPSSLPSPPLQGPLFFPVLADTHAVPPALCLSTSQAALADHLPTIRVEVMDVLRARLNAATKQAASANLARVVQEVGWQAILMSGRGGRADRDSRGVFSKL